MSGEIIRPGQNGRVIIVDGQDAELARLTAALRGLQKTLFLAVQAAGGSVVLTQTDSDALPMTARLEMDTLPGGIRLWVSGGAEAEDLTLDDTVRLTESGRNALREADGVDDLRHELDYLYGLLAVHLARARGDDAEADRLCDSPALERAGDGLTQEAVARVKKASADMYALAKP